MAIRFTGSAGCRISLGTLDVPASTGALSICAWFNADNFTTNGATIISKRNSSAESGVWWAMDVITVGAFKRLRVRIKTGTTTTTLTTSDVLTSLMPNQTYFVVLWYDGTNFRSYVNNIQAATVAKTGTVAVNDTVSTYIGEAPSVSQPFDGTIDDVRIYTRALSLAEMETIYYSHGRDGIVYGLYTRWIMREGYPPLEVTGGTVYDYSQNGKNGTPAGSPTYEYSLVEDWTKYIEIAPDTISWLEYHNFVTVSHAVGIGQIGEWQRQAGVGYTDETLIRWNSWSAFSGRLCYRATLRFVSNSKGTNTTPGAAYLKLQNKTDPVSWSNPPLFSDFAISLWDTQLDTIAIQNTGTYEFPDTAWALSYRINQAINGGDVNWGFVIGALMGTIGWYLSVDSVLLRMFYR